eukprot:scaffold69174_cov28-Tisochrysis_lutea.AAC.1
MTNTHIHTRHPALSNPAHVLRYGGRREGGKLSVIYDDSWILRTIWPRSGWTWGGNQAWRSVIGSCPPAAGAIRDHGECLMFLMMERTLAARNGAQACRCCNECKDSSMSGLSKRAWAPGQVDNF